MTEGPTKGPPFRPSLVVLVAGIVLAIPGLVVVTLGFWPILFGSSVAIPGTHRMHLDHGPYVVYERIGGTSRFGPVSITHLHGVSLGPRDLTVVDGHGQTVPVRSASTNETIDRNDDHYVSALRFDTPSAGSYELRFHTDRSGEVVVAHPMSEVLGARVPWIVASGLGWLTALAGITMLLTGVIRRGRASRRASLALAAATAAVPAAGWFPDPAGQHRLRYWDGANWTEHVSG